MATKLHFHSDSAFFSGSENMLVNFFSSRALRRGYELSLSYRWSMSYELGLQRRVGANVNATALGLADPAWLHQRMVRWPKTATLAVRVLSGLLLFKYWMTLWNIGVLWRHIRRARPDILHINNGGYPGALSCLAAAVAGRLCGVRAIVMVVNNLAIPYQGIRRWLDFPLDRLVNMCVSRYVTGSRAAADRLARVLALPHGKAVSLHNGICERQATESREQTRRRLGVPEACVCFGMVAILEQRKGHRVLLDAVNRLLSSDPDQVGKFVVLLEGDGPNHAAIESHLQSTTLAQHVRLVGVEDNVVNFMQSVDVLLLPSIAYEDFPNVILEAMMLGKPVIASRLAGIPEQVEQDRSGLLVAPGNVEGLAAAMSRLLVEPETRRLLGANGRARYESMFSADVAVSRYIQLYDEILKEEAV